MGEDETIQNEELAEEQLTEETPEVVESEQQQQQDPYAFPENLKSRYRSAAELADFAAQKQSEADKYKQQYETYKQQHPEATQTTNQPSNEEVLDRLVKDPVGFVKELTNDIRAQVALSEFARTHPKLDEYKEDIASIVNRTPGILADPDGLEMVYNLVERRKEAGKLNDAAALKATQNAQTQQTKKTDAFVEGATTPKQKASPKIVPGMSIAEQEKIMDEMGIGWITDEDRNREFE